MKTLYQNGFIIEDNINEFEIYENLYYKRRFSKKSYELTINPTLDCNLRCWYCYEDHVKKSGISEAMHNTIIEHLKYKCEIEPFNDLILSFFGGEPILKPVAIKKLLVRIKELAIKYNFTLHIHFTTNGTLLPKSLLNELKDCKVSFQITIDGCKNNHNSIRIKKNLKGENNTYDTIIKNIKLITNELLNSQINIRINFSNDTLYNLESLVDDLEFCDRKKVSFSLHKVWQIDSKSINKSKLFDFIQYANSRLFMVNFMILKNQYNTCYADNYNQAVINYNGNIYKCTARNFNEENSEGVLEKEGFIKWKNDKLMDRTNIRIADNCKKCKLLPSCPGVCSQKRIENKGKILCALDNDFTVEDYIVHNFNAKIIREKISLSTQK